MLPEIPKYVQSVLARLETQDHSAYLVGGCVRDLLMGRRPNDWDVCTSALPEEIMAAFPKTRPTGLQHGTVTVLTHVKPIEVTTFRADGEYLDHRRPESVCFLPDLSGDLSRRDFTVNAMALSRQGALLDLFDGQSDLQKRLIRCVGDPDRRFSEDALRMFRAFRFSAQLGFALETETRAEIFRNAPLCRTLARERVAVELEKTLLSPAPETVAELLAAGLLAGLANGAGAQKTDFLCLQNAAKSRAARWSALCALLLKKGMLQNAGQFLSCLRLDTATVTAASRGAELALSGVPGNTTAWKRLLCENGESACRCCAAACDALYTPGNTRLLAKAHKSGEPWQLSQLSVNGADLAPLDIEGPAVGKMLHLLLLHVVEVPSDNNKAALLALAASEKHLG